MEQTVFSPKDGMSREAQLFELVCLYPGYVERDVVPPGATEEEWHLVFDSAVAMDDARHDFTLGPWQCGYDDAIYEEMYDFITFQCQCPECEAEYKQGFDAGMKAEE